MLLFFHTVHEGTETTVHTDLFFTEQDVIVNALDNVEARVYMDQRCVDTARPLLESGTTGAKGHTQIVVPHLTESYGSQVCLQCYRVCIIYRSRSSLVFAILLTKHHGHWVKAG